MKYSNYSVIILGSGLSGLYLAYKLSKSRVCSDGILVVTKDELNSGSTPLAQGGIVSVIPEINPSDSVESHIKDTIKAGCGLNNLNTVKFVSENSFEVLEEFLNLGVEFDRTPSNFLDFTLEGAHSCPRILHAKGDSTGSVIEHALCEAVKKSNNIDIYTHSMGVELLVDSNNSNRGVVIYNILNNEFEAIYSNNVVIATGGIGQIYKYTTNPNVSTGDGIALALSAGAELSDMEFVQFHPTGLYCKNSANVPLVSESVRGEGAKLVNCDGVYFAKNYDSRADLAPRDVVARAIQSEIQKSGCEFVNLDISQIGIEKFRRRFPSITKLCEDNNVDISTGLLPVIPVQHYFMGGIKVDINSQTSIKNLYAIGECASTGLHGANRLASNSLLECFVFAKSLSEHLVQNIQNPPKMFDEKIKHTADRYARFNSSLNTNSDYVKELFSELKEVMSKYAGISRNEKGLKIAYETICEIQVSMMNKTILNSREKFELIGALKVAKEIVTSALKRKESIGAHFRDDCIQKQTDILEKAVKNDTLLA